MTLRIYADFNSGGLQGEGPRWLLRYGDDRRQLDEVAEDLELREGLIVTLFYEDEAEEFEVTATLQKSHRWVAWPDWSTMRRIRG